MTSVDPGTYYTCVVAYHDGSAVLGAYGIRNTEPAAEALGERLREAGVYPHENWTVTPLRVIELGPSGG